jgi:hypothetical protein
MAGASNDQHNQPNKSDTHQQHREIVFQPIPITGRHDVQPCFKRRFFLGARIEGVRAAIIDADQISFPADDTAAQGTAT